MRKLIAIEDIQSFIQYITQKPHCQEMSSFFSSQSANRHQEMTEIRLDSRSCNWYNINRNVPDKDATNLTKGDKIWD